MNSKKTVFPFVRAATTLLLSSSCAVNVLAQASEEKDSLSFLEEVVVTAQFREQSVQDTPIAITAVSGEMMSARGQTDISQLANQAPSVTMKPMGGSFGPSMGAAIRGIGQYDFNPALEPGVGLYVDDVYYPTLTGALFDLLDLERVEILRGPQGTLAGKNSIGGAVKMFSKKPAGDGGGYISALVGSESRAEFRGSTDFAVSDKISARLSGVFKSQDGYVDRIDYGCAFPDSGVTPNSPPGGDCTMSKMGEQGYHAFRTMVNYDVTENLSFLLSADYSKEQHTNAGEVLLYANNSLPSVAALGSFLDSSQICGEYCNYAAFSAPADMGGYATQGSDQTSHEGWGASLITDWQFAEDFALKSISAYRTYDTSWSQVNGASNAIANVGRNELDHWFLSQEFRISGQLSDTVFTTVGVYYANQQTDYFTIQDIRYIGFPLQFVGNDPVDADTKAVFANLSWDISDVLSLNLGARYTEESKDYTFSRLDYAGNPHWLLGSLNGETGHYEDEISDYRVAVNYRLNEDLMVYASTSTGYKGGGINPRPFNIGQVQSFNPEELTAYEIGVKGDLFDNHMRVNAAFFMNDYKDIQLTLLACPSAPCALPANVADAKVNGFELEAMIYPTEAMMIDFSMSILDFEYQDLASVESLVGTLNDVTPYTPEKKASIGIQYEFAMGDAGTLTPRFDASYQGDMYTNAGATAAVGAQGIGNVESYTVANFHLTWRNAEEDLEATFEVSNLFDKYYFLSKFDLSGAGAGLITGLPARPREVAFSVRKNF